MARVAKTHRLKRQNRFAGVIHRFDVLFEPARGAHRAQLADGVDHHRYGIIHSGCNAANARDKGSCLPNADTNGGIVATLSGVADIDIVIAGRELSTSGSAQCDVAVAGDVPQRFKTDGRIGIAG